MEYENQDSILATVKKMLGIDASYSVYDMDIIVLINSALMSLHQLGIGPKDGFMITDYTQTWKQLITNKVMLEPVKNYVYLKTRITFDPPSSSSVLEAYNKQIAELEWRMNVQAESVETFDFVTKKDTGAIDLDSLPTSIGINIEGESAGPTEEGAETQIPVTNTVTTSMHVEFDGENVQVVDGTHPTEDTVQIPLYTTTPGVSTNDPKARIFADQPTKPVQKPAYEIQGENLQLFTGLAGILG